MSHVPKTKHKVYQLHHMKLLNSSRISVSVGACWLRKSTTVDYAIHCRLDTEILRIQLNNVINQTSNPASTKSDSMLIESFDSCLFIGLVLGIKS